MKLKYLQFSNTNRKIKVKRPDTLFTKSHNLKVYAEVDYCYLTGLYGEDKEVIVDFIDTESIFISIEEPPVDWTKVPVDTKVLVRDCDESPWFRRYFSTYKNGEVYAFDYGTDSWSQEVGCTPWRQYKLWKEGEN